MEVELKYKRSWFFLHGCILIGCGVAIFGSLLNLFEALIRGQSYLFEVFGVATSLLLGGGFLGQLAFRTEHYLTEEGIRFETARTICLVRWQDFATMRLEKTVFYHTYLVANRKLKARVFVLNFYRPESQRALVEMLREKRPDIFPVETLEKAQP